MRRFPSLLLRSFVRADKKPAETPIERKWPCGPGVVRPALAAPSRDNARSGGSIGKLLQGRWRKPADGWSIGSA
jgi:hypothetical protein